LTLAFVHCASRSESLRPLSPVHGPRQSDQRRAVLPVLRKLGSQELGAPRRVYLSAPTPPGPRLLPRWRFAGAASAHCAKACQGRSWERAQRRNAAAHALAPWAGDVSGPMEGSAHVSGALVPRWRGVWRRRPKRTLHGRNGHFNSYSVPSYFFGLTDTHVLCTTKMPEYPRP
jgi:hypothetical protein